MSTTYDDIFESFLRICGYDYSEIPKTDNERYSMIQSAIKEYNSLVYDYEGKLRKDLMGDNISETLSFISEPNSILTNQEFKLIIHIMCKFFLEFKFTEFSSVWGTFTKETGIKDYKAQTTARLDTIGFHESRIDQILYDTAEVGDYY